MRRAHAHADTDKDVCADGVNSASLDTFTEELCQGHGHGNGNGNLGSARNLSRIWCSTRRRIGSGAGAGANHLQLSEETGIGSKEEKVAANSQNKDHVSNEARVRNRTMTALVGQSKSESISKVKPKASAKRKLVPVTWVVSASKYDTQAEEHAGVSDAACRGNSLSVLHQTLPAGVHDASVDTFHGHRVPGKTLLHSQVAGQSIQHHDEVLDTWGTTVQANDDDDDDDDAALQTPNYIDLPP